MSTEVAEDLIGKVSLGGRRLSGRRAAAALEGG
jgi:hypothetical protein